MTRDCTERSKPKRPSFCSEARSFSSVFATVGYENKEITLVSTMLTASKMAMTIQIFSDVDLRRLVLFFLVSFAIVSSPIIARLTS